MTNITMQELAVNDREFKRYWYGASITDFLNTEPTSVLGRLATSCEFAVLPTQRDAWLEQISSLQYQLSGVTGSIFFEFSIPRMGRRIDAVILTSQMLFAVEFKVGASTVEQSAFDQAWDYALDLKNFHEASHAASILPVVIATADESKAAFTLESDSDQVYRPVCVSPSQIAELIKYALSLVKGQEINVDDWARAPYHPTPTIVEAARSLYAQHSVEAIARYGAVKF